ncbi:MAG TPA: sugar phosphate nucleotidyltransferase [Candidatus Saccharimonadales bacterium]|nr:sugar phosphate nucleotidyltransferase [Candidatus Saccharimonadales bacterium]
MIKCSKAIITASGYGTRRLPITKAIDKCMLPVGNRPLIDFVVADCLAAGVEDIYLIVSQGNDLIRSYYSPNPELEAHLREAGKTAELAAVIPPAGVKFHFIDFDMSGKRGTAAAFAAARQFIGADDYALCFTGDDFIYNREGQSEAARLIEATEPGQSAMLGAPMDPNRLASYGVIVTHESGGRQVFDHIQEKPPAGEAKGELINVSKYLFHGSFFAELDRTMEGDPTKAGEYYITDPINAYVAAGHSLQVVEAAGRYLDGGTLDGWLKANQIVIAEQR